ncbi:MAG: exosortase/archaeosortase family protein, partial [Verrucomicrobia bacterium]|nr:exosortase/archaeosortase family protein [Verrucomicrobiota bacterium]
MKKESITPEPEVALGPANVDKASAWWLDRRLIGYFLYVGILSVACLEPLVALVRYALKEELHSHILLIPLVCIYLASLKRDSLPRDRRGSVGGAVVGALIFVVAAAAVFCGPALAGAAALSQNDAMTRAAACYALLLVAGGFAFLGTSWMRLLFFPFALLVFMVPLPDVIVVSLENFLMRASAEVVHWFFQWTGTPVFRSGQVMELPGTTLEVARNCSGIRSTVVLFITSLIASYMFLSSSWHRGLLVAMVIPLGILRNAMRVLVIGLLCVHVGPHMIDSWIHHKGGPLFF